MLFNHERPILNLERSILTMRYKWLYIGSKPIRRDYKRLYAAEKPTYTMS